MQFTMKPIGFVRGGRGEATKDHWGDNRSRIELDAREFGPEALAGLDQLSHIEVFFVFHLHADEPTERGARHPRDRTDWPKVGIFAQRGRMRPNRIGYTICRVVAVRGTQRGGRGARRRRRYAGARHQAGLVRQCAARRVPRAAVGKGTHGELLVSSEEFKTLPGVSDCVAKPAAPDILP